jgi:hypothetical protein
MERRTVKVGLFHREQQLSTRPVRYHCHVYFCEKSGIWTNVDNDSECLLDKRPTESFAEAPKEADVCFRARVRI